jgi:hypothetical protein
MPNAKRVGILNGLLRSKKAIGEQDFHAKFLDFKEQHKQNSDKLTIALVLHHSILR